MKKSITSINKTRKPEKKKSMIPLYIQFTLTILLLILGIVSFIYKDLFFYFRLLLSVTIIDMGVNNYLVYKRRYVTILYIVVGLVILLSTVLGW